MSEAKPRVLLVDDEPSIIKMATRRLEITGFEVLVAADGEDALAKARSDSPDIIILDLMLPKITGLKVCTTLKQDARLRQIPIIMYTGKGDVIDPMTWRECGADACVTKTAGVAALILEMKELLERRRAQGSDQSGTAGASSTPT